MGHEPQPSAERPLSRRRLLALGLSAGALILVFYLFAVASVIVLATLLGIEVVLFGVLLRFGMSRLLVDPMKRHLAILRMYFTWSPWRSGGDGTIRIVRADAPRLFDLVEQQSRALELAMADEVILGMSVNAWVRLQGYRRGVGRTTLGVGFDLLAGLSEREFEGVLAHELAHAKLIQRGFKRWLGAGLNYASLVTDRLSAQSELARRTKQTEDIEPLFLRGAQAITRRCARLVSACFRQDEFAADRGAVALCGAAPVRSALVKIQKIAALTQRLSWRERVGQLQLSESYSNWLARELTDLEGAHSPETEFEATQPYSTHPSVQDRLQALPDAEPDSPLDSASALALLLEPDQVAERLILEIQRGLAADEQRDSRDLERQIGKRRASSHLRPLEIVGTIVVVVGFFIGLAVLLTPQVPAGIAWILGSAALGWACFRVRPFRERMVMPIPAFGLLSTASSRAVHDADSGVTRIEQELRSRTAPLKRAGKRARLLVDASLEALAGCDYVRAQVAATLCLEERKNSVSGVLALMVASAGLGQNQQVWPALIWLNARTRLSDPSTAWGAAWAMALVGDWLQAEALLHRARKGHETEPTLLSLLALSQGRRGKLQSAILHARQACTLAPQGREHAKLLVNLLLEGGHVREAESRLQQLQAGLGTDPELMALMVRLNLLRRDHSGADAWSHTLIEHTAEGRSLLRLARFHEEARRAHAAEDYYRRALESGYYPEALLGLARLAHQRREPDQARQHLLEALNLHRPLAEHATSPLHLLGLTLNQLVELERETLPCQAWIVTFTGRGGPKPLANVSFLVYSPSREQAGHYFHAILAAMEPATPPLQESALAWRLAPKVQQPDWPVRPGVQGIID